MLLRTWKVALAPGKGPELEDFAAKFSLPMFRECAGCLAVLFTRTESHCLTVTAWASEQELSQAEESASYRDVVQRIELSGLLSDDHSTEVFTVYGGFVTESFVQALNRNPLGVGQRNDA
jgi:heme-degrading monooxygenase HmoA